MPQLNPEFFTSQVFWLVLVFSSIYLFVAYFFIPRIGNAVISREAQIEQDVYTSEKLIEEYKALEVEASRAVEDAKHEAFSIIDKASKSAEIQINERMAVIEKDIRKSAAYEEEKLSRFKSQMQGSIVEIAQGLKSEIIVQLLRTLEGNKSKSN
jgi:F-type H+-transporting ATPase subunit b